MAYYPQTLIDLIGRIQRSRPGIDRSLSRDFLNERMRSVLDMRPIWSGLVKNVTVSIPNIYTTGLVSVTTGSRNVTGTGTTWPVSDKVNTTFNEQISAPGAAWVTPASMQGITRDTILYVDATGTPEARHVLDIRGPRVLLGFGQAHAAGSTLTSSSLSNLQFRVGGYLGPVFTVNAVTDPQTILLDQPWGAGSLTNAAYQILLMYVTLDPLLKGVLSGFDPVQQAPLSTNILQDQLNQADPNRTAANSPVGISPRGPDRAGCPQFEIYPPQTTPYQLSFRIYAQWPDMQLPSDSPPPFMNPNVLIYGALADAFRTPCPRPPDFKDPGLNLQSAQTYEEMFMKAVQDLIQADEMLIQQSLTWNYGGGYGLVGNMGDTRWSQSHDVSAVLGDF